MRLGDVSRLIVHPEVFDGRDTSDLLPRFYYSFTTVSCLQHGVAAKPCQQEELEIIQTKAVNFGAGRGIFLNPFPAANGIKKMQCFA